MSKRSGDIVSPQSIKAMEEIRAETQAHGWAPIVNLRLFIGSGLTSKFVETNGAYVRLTPDAQTILEFSKSLESKCPPATK